MTRRAVQLDGVRGLSMAAICWDHWCPVGWPRVFPFEIFLFFFLVMTGYLITGSLLRERDRGESRGIPWRAHALKIYQIRRSLRILAPYYVALLLSLILGAPDVLDGFWWYAAHLSNLHMAVLGHWPPGTNHFWSLSMQQQFYLIWPFVIWWLPKRWLPIGIGLMILAGPLARFHHDAIAHWVAWPQLLTWASLDYFGLGAFFAWLVWRGMPLDCKLLRTMAWCGFTGYLLIFNATWLGFSPDGWKFLQQTLLSVGLCGFIASVSIGQRGPVGRFLEWAPLQRLGQLSYGLYLFHNLAPLLAGKLFWILWDPRLPKSLANGLQILTFAITAWGLTLASWHWIERPLQDLRTRFSGGAKST